MQRAPAPQVASGGIDVAAIRRAWPDILGWIFKHKRTTWTLLSEHATVHDYDGSKVVLGISTVGIANTFRHGPHADLVRQALIDVLGVDARVEGIPTPDAALAAPSGEAHPTVAPGNRYPSDDPAVKGDSPPPSASPRAGGEAGSGSSGARNAGGGNAAYGGIAASSPPPETGGGWAMASSGPSGGPSWASDDATSGSTGASGGAPPSASTGATEQGAVAAPAAAQAAQMSRLAAARAAVAAEEPARTPDTYIADDSVASADDEDIAELGEVGRPVIERLLGGKVIDEGS